MSAMVSFQYEHREDSVEPILHVRITWPEEILQKMLRPKPQMHCPVNGCVFVTDNNLSNRKINCPEHGTMCALCWEAVEESNGGDSHENWCTHWPEEFIACDSIRRCPWCLFAVQRVDGCDFMQCKYCFQKFQWQDAMMKRNHTSLRGQLLPKRLGDCCQVKHQKDAREVRNEDEDDEDDDDEEEDKEVQQQDIDLIVSQTHVSREQAESALREYDGDIVNAIMALC